MTILELTLYEKNIKKKDIAKLFSITAYHAGQKIKYPERLKFNEILKILKITENSFEELFEDYIKEGEN